MRALQIATTPGQTYIRRVPSAGSHNTRHGFHCGGRLCALPAAAADSSLSSRRPREQALSFCCYGCLTVFRLVGATGDAGRAGWFLAKLGLAAVLSGNIMMFQSLLYFGSLDALGSDVLRTASWLMLALAAAVYLLLGVPMLRAAYRAARSGHIVLETLIALGALAAIGASAVETVRGGRQLYYDSGTMVLVFVVLGQYLDARARERATATLAPAVETARPRARVLEETGEREVAPDEVRRGERVRVRAGEEIPVDGRVIEGASDVSEPALTGESAPRLVGPGDIVFAGSVAVDGALVLEAAGESETLVSRVDRWTREARSRRAPVEIAADRFVARFVPGVALIALASALAWGVAGRRLGPGRPGRPVRARRRVSLRARNCDSDGHHDRDHAGRPGGELCFAAARCSRPWTASGWPPSTRRERSRAGGPPCAPSGWIPRRDCRRRTSCGVRRPSKRPSIIHLRGPSCRVPERGGSPFRRRTRSVPSRAGGADGRVGSHRVLLGSRSLLAREGVSDLERFDGNTGNSAVGVAIDGRLVAVIRARGPGAAGGARRDRGPEVARHRGRAPVRRSGRRRGSRAAKEAGIDQAHGDLDPQAKLEALRRWRADRAAS